MNFLTVEWSHRPWPLLSMVQLYIKFEYTVMWSGELVGKVYVIFWDISLTCWILSMSLSHATSLFTSTYLMPSWYTNLHLNWDGGPDYLWNSFRITFLFLKNHVCSQLRSSIITSCKIQEVSQLSSIFSAHHPLQFKLAAFLLVPICTALKRDVFWMVIVNYYKLK